MTDIAELDKNVTKLNDSFTRLNEMVPTYTLHNSPGSAYSHDGGFYNQPLLKGANNIAEIQAPKKEHTLFDDAQPYVVAAESLGKIASNGIKIYEAFETLPPVLGTVKTGVNVLNGTLKAFEGIGELAEATGLLEGITAVDAIIAGVEGVVTATATLGPVGWAVGAGAIVIGGVAAVALSQTNEDSKTESFADEARKNGNPYLIRTEQSAKTAEEYIREAKELDDRTRIPRETELLKNSFLKQSSINFDYRKAEGNDPVYLQGLVGALIQNEKSTKKSIKQVLFDSKEDMEAFKSRYDPYGHFHLVTKDYIGIQKTQRMAGYGDGPPIFRTYTDYISPKENDIRNGKYAGERGFTKQTEMFKNDILVHVFKTYMTNGFEYVQKEYESKLKVYKNMPDFLNATKQVWQLFLSAKELRDYENEPHPNMNRSMTRSNASINTAGFAPARKVININLNKPMIEHFTINTKEIKEGLNDFKHKVEEVLLEILNSATH